MFCRNLWDPDGILTSDKLGKYPGLELVGDRKG